MSLETLVSEIREPALLGNDFLRAAEVTVNFSKGLVTVWGREAPQTMSIVCRCVVYDDVSATNVSACVVVTRWYL